MAEGRQDAVAEPAATPEATAVAAYLGLAADTLVDRSIDFAKRNGYAPFTTTIRAAWLEAILSLSEALVRYLSLTRKRLGPEAGCDYETDPRFARMRQIARKHRARGVTLQLYLGLFKHFRRVYLEVLKGLDPKPGVAMLSDVLDFFDETELSIASDWTGTTKEENLRELQARTRQLALEKDRYFAIFESLRNPAFLLDRERALVHANHAAAEIFVGNVAAGDSVYLRSREDVRTRLREVLRDLPLLTDDPERTVWLETIQGRRCFEMRLRVLHDTVENIPLGYLLQFYDVTAHRQATETAQQAELQMSRFLATMSHEIRTPLHSVLGAAELLRQADRDSQDSYLDVIQAAGQSLLQTLNNVLDYSKLGGGPPEPRPVETDIAAALDTFCATVAIGHEARRTSLSLELDGALPDRLMIDWAIVRQVLTNLVTNALRHDGGGGVCVRVGPVRQTAGQDILRFEVTDHGPGLPEAEAEALFRPFHEIRPRNTAGGGAGLGLAISHELVRGMHGRIGFENTCTGARVWFEIPFTVRKAGDTPEPPAVPEAVPSGRRCLLVDDDPIGSMISAHHLTRIGYLTDHAATMAEARAAAQATSYDALVVDYLLPDGTGPELVRTLQAEQLCASARIVGLTANVEALNASSQLSAAFDVILAKPADGATLAQAVLPFARRRARPPVAAETRQPGLEGLSAATVAEMATAFEVQWEEFRTRLQTLAGTRPEQGLGDLAHRLAGSSSQLGLSELVQPLRELETRCAAGETGLQDLVRLLDHPVTACASWTSLSVGGVRP